MADVATSVLHNIGNVLNSVSVSAKLLLERIREDKFTGLNDLARFLATKQDNNSTQDFLQNHPIGKRLPEYLQQFSKLLEEESRIYREELQGLNDKIEHIKDIVATQQSLSKSTRMVERVNVEKLVEDALAMNTVLFKQGDVSIIRDYSKVPAIQTDRVKMMQILVNLLKNAGEALLDCANQRKELRIQTQEGTPGFIEIKISDNGKGISPDHMQKIFSHGFTTKKEGHGFGLHASAMSAQDSGGSIRAHSDGPNRGATFVLTLPVEGHN